MVTFLISSLMQAVFHSSMKSPLVREMLKIAVISSIMCCTSCLNNEVDVGSSLHCLVGMFIMIHNTSCENMGQNLSKIWISLCCGVYFGKWSRLSVIFLILVWKKSTKFSARVSKQSHSGSGLDWIVPIRLDTSAYSFLPSLSQSDNCLLRKPLLACLIDAL